MAQSLLRHIRKQGLLRAGDRIGVAVSGGADSVALLRILLELRDEMGLVLSVVHLNHCLRADESDGDEQFVRDLASHHDLPFHSTRRDVRAHATLNKLSIETAARELRYQYFEDLLRQGHFNKLVTAHTLDDQAETVLLKLARGAGTRGLAGIYPIIQVNSTEGAQLAIVRPLLGIQRSEVEFYLSQIRQPWREDSTNRELHHTRNRIRHEILPKLVEHVNPDVRETLAEAAEIARADEEFWARETLGHLPLVWSLTDQGGRLDVSGLGKLPLALRRRLVRAAAESLGLRLEFRHVEEVLALSHEGARITLPAEWTARTHRGLIRFETGVATGTTDYEYPLSVPGIVELARVGLIVAASPAAKNTLDRRYNPDHLLDRRFAQDLRVRNWRAGDRFWPSHTREPRKIKELLQDRHITGEQKKSWPVIASGDEVVWVRGFGVRRDLQAQNGSGVLIKEEPLEKGDQSN